MQLNFTLPTPSPYAWLLLGGILVSAVFWSRLARRDDRLLIVYVAALIGGFVGAKAAYLLVEGWRDLGTPDVGMRWITGKSIVGALLGGYAGVELAKRRVGYSGVTGDWFAVIAPAGILLGRLGCWLHGCCLGTAIGPAWFTIRDSHGVERWPAVPVEMIFNLGMLALLLTLRRAGRLAGQHFHLYLISYGVFRFMHEFVRDTPRMAGSISGYQLLAVVMAIFGAVAFRKRARAGKSNGSFPPHRPSLP